MLDYKKIYEENKAEMLKSIIEDINNIDDDIDFVVLNDVFVAGKIEKSKITMTKSIFYIGEAFSAIGDVKSIHISFKNNDGLLARLG